MFEHSAWSVIVCLLGLLTLVVVAMSCIAVLQYRRFRAMGSQKGAQRHSITIEPDLPDRPEEIIEVICEAKAAEVLDGIPEAVLSQLEKAKGIIVSVPPDVASKLRDGQYAFLEAYNEPLRIVSVEKAKDATIMTPRTWELPHAVDYVGSAWKMLSFLVGQMNTTRIRSTLADIHSILQHLQEHNRDESLGNIKGNLRFLAEIRKFLDEAPVDWTTESYLKGLSINLDTIYREGLQGISTYELALSHYLVRLPEVKISSFHFSEKSIGAFVRLMRDYGTDTHILLSALYSTVVSVGVAANVPANISGLLNTRVHNALDTLANFELRNEQWWRQVEGRLRDIDDAAFNRTITKERAKARVKAAMLKVKQEIKAFCDEIRRLLMDALRSFSQFAEARRMGLRYRLISDGGRGVSRIELLRPLT